MKLENKKVRTEIWHNYIVMAALIIGAVITVYEFYLSNNPYIQISQEVDTIYRSDSTYFIRVRVQLENKGNATKSYPHETCFRVILNDISSMQYNNNILSYGNQVDIFKTPMNKFNQILPSTFVEMYANFLVPNHIPLLSVNSYITKNCEDDSDTIVIHGHKPIFTTHDFTKFKENY